MLFHATFSIAAWLSGSSDSIYSLIFGALSRGCRRLLIPVGQALVFALFPNNDRQRISTLIMTVALIAPAFSPAIGGLIIDSLSWHWVFYSNLPFSLLTAVLAWIWIKMMGKIREKPDILGLIMVSLSLLNYYHFLFIMIITIYYCFGELLLLYSYLLFTLNMPKNVENLF
ncbi:MFS transporter [Providencia rettgeri]|nr:MFS transporter [Providencia rettgeri]